MSNYKCEECRKALTLKEYYNGMFEGLCSDCFEENQAHQFALIDDNKKESYIYCSLKEYNNE